VVAASFGQGGRGARLRRRGFEPCFACRDLQFRNSPEPERHEQPDDDDRERELEPRHSSRSVQRVE
jgi:hypothetical protein